MIEEDNIHAKVFLNLTDTSDLMRVLDYAYVEGGSLTPGLILPVRTMQERMAKAKPGFYEFLKRRFSSGEG